MKTISPNRVSWYYYNNDNLLLGTGEMTREQYIRKYVLSFDSPPEMVRSIELQQYSNNNQLKESVSESSYYKYNKPMPATN